MRTSHRCRGSLVRGGVFRKKRWNDIMVKMHCTRWSVAIWTERMDDTHAKKSNTDARRIEKEGGRESD